VPTVESNAYTKAVADTAVKVAGVVVQQMLKTVEPYHDQVDMYGNKVLDVAENAVVTGKQIVVKAEDTVLAPLDAAVKGVDYVVDYVLPPSSKEKQPEEEDDQFVDADESIDSRPQPFSRAYQVTTKATSRLYGIVSAGGQKAIHDTEELLRLRATLEILQEYHSHLEASSQRLKETLQSTSAYLAEATRDREKFVQSVNEAKEFGIEKIAKPTMDSVLVVQQKLIDATVEMRTTVTRAIATMSSRVPSMPSGLQSRLSQLVQSVQKRWENTLQLISEPSASLKEGKLSIDDLLANVKDLTNKSLQMIDVSTEGIQLVSTAKGLIGGYLGYTKETAPAK